MSNKKWMLVFGVAISALFICSFHDHMVIEDLTANTNKINNEIGTLKQFIEERKIR